MISPLERLCGPHGSLHPEPANEAELRGLLQSGAARLRDATNDALALESRFDLVNLGEYEGDTRIDARIVADMIVATTSVARAFSRE